MIGTYAAAVLICGASVILGRGVIVAAGGRASSWIAPAVGFAALMIVCEVAIRLPGHAYTAIVALFVAVGASLLAVRWRGRGERLSIDGLPVGIALLAVASTPFVANARVGVLGISFLNDTHWHLLLAEQLRHPSYRALETFGPGYPVGPHAIATTFAQLLGTGVDNGLTGMLMSVPVLTGLTALAGLERITRSRAWLVAVLAGVPYLAAAFYGESAFKEPILAMLMLAGVLVLEQWRRESFARPATALALIAVLVAGVVYVYSYPGLLWPLAIGVCWVLLWLVIGGGWRGLRRLPRAIGGARIPLIAAVVLLVVLVAPDIGRLHTFWRRTAAPAPARAAAASTRARWPTSPARSTGSSRSACGSARTSACCRTTASPRRPSPASRWSCSCSRLLARSTSAAWPGRRRSSPAG